MIPYRTPPYLYPSPTIHSGAPENPNMPRSVLTLAISYTAMIALFPQSCVIPTARLSSSQNPAADADAVGILKQTVVTTDGKHTLATTPVWDPLTTVLNAALSAIVVVAIVAFLYWAARRILNGRVPLLLLSVSAALASCSGCWAPKPPGTSLSLDPQTRSVEFYDTKDNRVVVEGLDLDATTRSAHLDRLEIDNRASTVIEMQVLQMAQWNLQMQTANEGIRTALAGIATIVDHLTPLVAPAPPAGLPPPPPPQ